MATPNKSVCIVKFPKGYLQTAATGSLVNLDLTPFVERATVFERDQQARMYADKLVRHWGKYEVLTGESIGHLIHRLKLEEGSYVHSSPLLGLHGRNRTS